jgi:hypothetical protein
MLAPWGRRLQLGRRVRPFPRDHCIVGKSLEGSRQPGGEARTPLHPSSSPPAERTIGPATCGSYERVVPAPARCCPPFAGQVRTQRGPRVDLDTLSAELLTVVNQTMRQTP